MQPHSFSSRSSAPLAAALIALAAACSAPAPAVEPRPALPLPENDDGFALLSGGLDALLVDPKDAGLRAALRRLSARIERLPRELGSENPPPDALALATETLLGPMSVRVNFEENGEALPVQAQLAVHCGSASGARAFSERFGALLRQGGFGEPVVAADGLSRLSLGPTEAVFSARETEFVLALGRPRRQPLRLGSLGLPPGVVPALACKLDLARFAAMLDGLGSTRPAQRGAEPGNVLERLGFADLTLFAAAGVDSERAHAIVHVPGHAAALERTTGLPASPLSRRALGMVPRDAVWATVGTLDFPGTFDWLLALAAEDPDSLLAGRDPLEELTQLTGVRLREDLLEHLSGEWGAYLSESSGGGGLASLVVFAALADEEAARATLARLEARVDELAAEHARGRAAFRRWSRDGIEYATLTFPGLPVPLEPTLAIVDGWLVKGLTPQAAIAGVEQARGRGAGLLGNARFREMAGGPLDDLFSVSFLDSPRLLADGYGWSAALAAALANGVAEPNGTAALEPPLVLPPFDELARGARASVTLARLQGGDLVERTQADRSMWVNATALFGLCDRVSMLFAGPVLGTLVLPRVIGELFRADQAVAASDITAICNALDTHALQHGGRYPDSLEELIVPDANGERYLRNYAAVPLDPWGRPYGYTPPDGTRRYRVFTLGADGRPGGSGDSMDLDNLILLERRNSR